MPHINQRQPPNHQVNEQSCNHRQSPSKPITTKAIARSKQTSSRDAKFQGGGGPITHKPLGI